jgi:hypothetical protein
VRQVEMLGGTDGVARCRVELDPSGDARPALAACVAAHGWGLLALAPVATTLEEAFLRLVAGDEARGAAP